MHYCWELKELFLALLMICQPQPYSTIQYSTVHRISDICWRPSLNCTIVQSSFYVHQKISGPFVTQCKYATELLLLLYHYQKQSTFNIRNNCALISSIKDQESIKYNQDCLITLSSQSYNSLRSFSEQHIINRNTITRMYWMFFYCILVMVSD